MPLDAIFLSHLTKELNENLVGGRVDKIHMPSRDDLVMAIRTHKGGVKLLVSANSSGARLHLTEESRENPKTPSMLCMLFRKYLSSARVISVSQEPLERVAYITFECMGELGDIEQRRLILELTGRSANMILTGAEDRVIAALHYIDISEERSRQIIVGVKYELPKSQGKLMMTSEPEKVRQYVMTEQSKLSADKFILYGITGISPLIAREVAARALGAVDISMNDVQKEGREKLYKEVSGIFNASSAGPILMTDLEGTPTEFTFTDIVQYGELYKSEKKESYSKLLDAFYLKRDRAMRAKQRSSTLAKIVSNSIERISKRLSVQQGELENFGDREKFRIFGELLTASIHAVPKGAPYVELTNYYEEEGPLVRIPLDITKTPSVNAQLYFKRYQKAKNGEKILREQIEKGKTELEYLATVQASMSSAENERDIAEIRAELVEQGYISRERQKGKAKPQKIQAGEPLKFVSKDGFTMLVGKNNIQNDRLVSSGDKDDWWLHVLNAAGSHVLIKAEGREVPNETLEEGAILAAKFSSLSNEINVPVTYTKLRNVKKPSGSKPGYVIFSTSKTAFVNPNQE